MESERRGRGNRGRRPRRGNNPYRNEYQPHSESYGPVQVSKPVFKQVFDISPEMTGVNIKLKVVSSTSERKEFLMGDDTGSVIVVVNNENVLQRLREGSSVILRNGFVEMKSDAFIRITTNEWGKISVSDEDFTFTVKKGNNISEVEYTIE